MPVWAAIGIALVSGLFGGLLGTLAKIADDRGAEVRRATIEATQDFAALATDWFDAVGAAITVHEEEDGQDDGVAVQRARDLIKQGNTRLDRLAVLLGPGDPLVRCGAVTLRSLSVALDELPGPLIEIDLELTEDDEAELDALPEEGREERYADMLYARFGESVAEARFLHRQALDGWSAFASVAASELRRGLVPSLRSDARLIRRARRH